MKEMSRRVRLAALAVAGLVMVGCSREPPTGTSEAPALAKGGKPSGGGSTLIPYVKLANLKALGCSAAAPRDISPQSPSATVVRVVGYAVCGGSMRLFTWTGSSGASLIGDATFQGIVEGVADDETMVGDLRAPGPPAFVINRGATSSILPLPTTGYLYAEASAVSRDGNFAAGYGAKLNQGFADCGQYGSCAYHLLRWSRSGSGWAGPVVVSDTGGSAAAITADGRLIVGSLKGHAVLWSQGTPWNVQRLPEDLNGGTVALGSDGHAINGNGDVIVGSRLLPLQRDPTIQYDEHAVWRKDGTIWKIEPLKGYNIAEGIAYDVADYHGTTVVVGYSWDNTSGKGGTQWPTYWTWDRNAATTFSPPNRLSQINEAWGGSATAVNSLGQIVGVSATGSLSAGEYPVMWKLP